MILNTSLVLITWCNAGMYGEAGVRSLAAADEMRLWAAAQVAWEDEFRGIEHPQWLPPPWILHMTQTHDQDQIPVLSVQGPFHLKSPPTCFHTDDWLRCCLVHKDLNCALPVGCVCSSSHQGLRISPVPWVIPSDICCFKSSVPMPRFPL